MGGIEYLSIVMASASFSPGKLLLQIWFLLLLVLLMCASERVSESLLFLRTLDLHRIMVLDPMVEIWPQIKPNNVEIVTVSDNTCELHLCLLSMM